MAKIRNKVNSEYNRVSMKPKVGRLVQWSLEVRRFMILGERLANGELIGHKYPNVSDQPVIDAAKKDLIKVRGDVQDISSTKTHTNFTHNSKNKSLKDAVSIIDIDSKGVDRGYENIILPFIPREVDVNPESTYATIKGIGRNTSKYQFTGSEDRIEFEIDWYANDQARREVITKCRKLEALSKTDGYAADSHRVMLQWGDGDILFQDQVFIVLSAKYKLVNFNKGYMTKAGELVSTHLLPIQAYQKVILGRISSHNLTTIDIEHVAVPPSASNTETRSTLNKGV